MSVWLRFGSGAALAAVVLVVAGWFDGTVMRAARQEVGRTFEVGPALATQALGYLVIAGGSLAIGVAGWRLRSLGLAISYVVAGAFFTFLDTIYWQVAAGLPDPIAYSVNRIFEWQSGPLNAGSIVGAATLIVGVAILVATFPRMSVSGRSEAP